MAIIAVYQKGNIKVVPELSENAIPVRARADKSGVWNITDNGTRVVVGGPDSSRETLYILGV